MPQDLFTLKKTATALNDKISGAVINKVVQPTPYEFSLVLYNGKQFGLVFSANGNLSRLSTSSKIYKSPAVAPNFCMLLRKHILGGRISSVKIANEDRIFAVEIINENEFKLSKTYVLYLEIMSKFSNAFLTLDGVILGCLKQTPQNIDGKRITLSGAKYAFYEKPNKICAQNSAEIENAFLHYSGENLNKFILDTFLDFSPISAKEIKYRHKSMGLTAKSALLNFLNEPLRPTIIKSENKVDFYPFDYKHISGERVYFDDFLKMQEHFFESRENASVINSYKSVLTAKVLNYEKKLIKKIEIFKSAEKDYLDSEKYRLYGELLTANFYKLKKGQSSVILENYYDENQREILISLDENLTPQENAQRYFKKYSKIKKSYEHASKIYQTAISELEYVKSLKYEISTILSERDYEDIKEELINQGILSLESMNNKKNKQKVAKNHNFLKYKIGEFSLLLGKNNLQNDALFSETSRHDIWIHVKNYHSAHGYIITENKVVPSSVLKTACEIVASRSEASSSGKVDVDYTYKKFVKKQSNKKPGSVYYTDYKTITVEPKSHEELVLN